MPTPTDVDVYDAKAVALAMVERISGSTASVRALGNEPRAAGLHPRGAAEVVVGDAIVGRFGPLHPEVVEAFDLGGPALVIELDLEALGRLGKLVPRYRPVPRLPAVTRDLSLVVAEELFAENVASALAGAAGALCESIEVVGDFRGGSVPSGRRSLTFRVVYRDPKARTGADDAQDADRSRGRCRREAHDGGRALELRRGASRLVPRLVLALLFGAAFGCERKAPGTGRMPDLRALDVPLGKRAGSRRGHAARPRHPVRGRRPHARMPGDALRP